MSWPAIDATLAGELQPYSSSPRSRTCDLEPANQTGKLVADIGKMPGRGVRFFHQGDVLLGHLVHVAHRGVDLADADGLFLRRAGDGADNARTIICSKKGITSS